MAKSLHELISERFGVRTRVVRDPVTATVGVNSEQILRADSTRLAFLIINLSGAIIYISPSEVAVATGGIRLNPNGGLASFSFLEDFNLPGLEWTAISTLAGANIMTLAIVVEPGE